MSLTGTSSSIIEYLPNLPGFRGSTMKANGQKKQAFHFVQGQIFMKEEVLPPVGNGNSSIEDRSVLSIGTTSNILTSRPKSRAEKQEMMRNANIVLTFQAYFREESAIEELVGDGEEGFRTSVETRIRSCNIYFYADTGAMMIVEKPQLNSGIPQGKLVKKSVVLKPDGTQFTPADLQLGNEIVVYNRRYHLIDCDSATRKFLKNATGITQVAAIEPPVDAYMSQRKLVERSHDDEWGKYHSKKNPSKTFMEVMGGNYVDNSGREGFMRFGKETLKFKCVWDNTSMLYGDRQEFSMVYHLCDDGIEIFGLAGPNSGRDQFSRLLKKSKLPKTLGPMSLEPTEVVIPYFHWTDFYIGLEMDVYARTLRIVDSDNKTREFYAQYGVDLGQAELPPEPEIVVYEREIPPHNGIGSEEDTMRSCNGPLMPGPVPAKKLGENKMLSFFASLLSGGPDDVDRRFVITFYVQDGTVKIQEPPVRNSGFNGGVFLSRRAVKAEDGEPLGVKHLYIGCKVRILKHRFLLLGANESTLRWMEDPAHIMPRASFYDIVAKIRQVALDDACSGKLTDAFAAQEEEPGSGQVTKEGLVAVLVNYNIIGDHPDDISEHELLTIVRANGNKSTKFNYVKLIEQIVSPTDEFK